MIEKHEKDIINRKYFAEGFGEVKRESVMTTEEVENTLLPPH